MSKEQQRSGQNVQEMLIEKAHELFALCDKENKGIMTKRDMQGLREELPLTQDQLEVVFDSLDKDHNGYLSLQEFTDGFGMFLGIDTNPQNRSAKRHDLNHEMEFLEDIEEEIEEEMFEDVLEQMGAKHLFKDQNHIRQIWIQLRSENIEMSRKFEDFLRKLAQELKHSETEYINLETALKNRISQHDEEVQQLYEEMERQMTTEKDRLLKEERNREKKVREVLEIEILQKEKQLQDLIVRQSEMEQQLSELSSNSTETKQENIKLQKERDSLKCRLAESEQLMQEMQKSLEGMRQVSLEDKRRRAKATFQVTEGIAMERECLVKELDVLRSMNRQLLDEKDVMNSNYVNKMNSIDEDFELDEFSENQILEPNVPVPSPRKLLLVKQGSVLSNYIGTSTASVDSLPEENNEEITQKSEVKMEPHSDCTEWANGSHQNSPEDIQNSENTESTSDTNKNYSHENCLVPSPPDNVFLFQGDNSNQIVWKVKCIIFPAGISDMSNSTDELKDEWKVKKSYESMCNGDVRQYVATSEEVVKLRRNFHNVPLDFHHSVDKDAQYWWKVSLVIFPVPLLSVTNPEEILENDVNVEEKTQTPVSPERVFKIVFIGDSGVGKSSFIQRFCNNEFRPHYSATIGVDFQIRSVDIDGRTVALQLWDTAGQERFRSITKQYYRKADGVIVMYDVTSEMSFRSVRSWINSIRDVITDHIVILLVGNKIDLCPTDHEKVVRSKDGRQLAEEFEALFYETSSRTGEHLEEAVMELAGLLQVREDEELEKTLKLKEGKKNKCC